MRVSIADPEAVVRAILSVPIELSNAEAARIAGVSRTSAREIRTGRKFADVLPNIPRVDPAAMGRTCIACTHFVHRRIYATATEPERSGLCGLGHAEAADLRFARGCEAYAEGGS